MNPSCKTITKVLLTLEFIEKAEFYKPLIEETFANLKKTSERARRKKIVDPLAEKQRLKDAKQRSKPV